MPKIRLQRRLSCVLPLLFVLLCVSYAWAIVVMRGRGYTRPPLPSVLIWRFANTNNPTDDSSLVGTNVGTLGAGGAEPTWMVATGGVSAYYEFDGNDFIEAADNPTLSFGDGASDRAFTAMGWFRAATGEDNNVPIIGKNRMGAREWALRTVDTGGNRYLYFFSVDESTNAYRGRYASSPLIIDSVWYHAVGTYDGSGIVGGFKLYLRGLRIDNNDYSDGAYVAMEDYSAPVEVARTYSSVYTQGGVDDGRIYSNILSATAISDIYWNSATNHGVSKWDYDNRSDWSNTVFVQTFSYDGSRPADTGFIGTHHMSKGAGGAQPTHLDNAVNGFYQFEWTDYITLDNDASLYLTNFTITAWIKRDADHPADLYSTVIAKGDNNGSGVDNNYQLSVLDSTSVFPNRVYFLVGDGAASTTSLISNTEITNVTWTHVAAVYDDTGNSHSIYINGVLDTNAVTTLTPHNASGGVTIGTWFIAGSEPFSEWGGHLDEIRQYNVALSAATISNIYHDTKFLFVGF